MLRLQPGTRRLVWRQTSHRQREEAGQVPSGAYGTIWSDSQSCWTIIRVKVVSIELLLYGKIEGELSLYKKWLRLVGLVRDPTHDKHVITSDNQEPLISLRAIMVLGGYPMITFRLPCHITNGLPYVFRVTRNYWVTLWYHNWVTRYAYDKQKVISHIGYPLMIVNRIGLIYLHCLLDLGGRQLLYIYPVQQLVLDVTWLSTMITS
jgi:hypothetical protein